MRKGLKERIGTTRPLFKTHELTDREREIVTLICQEFTNKEIGEKLSLSERTVENHRYRVMEKLDIKSTVGLVHFAYNIRLIE